MSERPAIRPEESRSATIKRRLVSIPTVYLLFVVVTVLIVPLLIVLGAWDVFTGLRHRRPPSAVRLILVLWALLFADVIGLIALFVTWLASGFGTNERRLESTAFAIQSVWAAWMMAVATRVFSLEVEVTGREDATPGPYVLLVRHSSMVDNLLPSHSISVPLGIELRYVMKRELLKDPCFDVAGRRLRNHFVDRDTGGPDELARIRDLACDMGPGDGVLIYPEGTRFTEAKRARALERIAETNPARAERMSVLTRCLPPRHGGPLALLEAAPAADVVLLTHVGFEGLRGIGDVLAGDLVGRTVVVRLVRFPRAEIPEGGAAAEWLDSLWLEVDDWVVDSRAALARGESAPDFIPKVALGR